MFQLCPFTDLQLSPSHSRLCVAPGRESGILARLDDANGLASHGLANLDRCHVRAGVLGEPKPHGRIDAQVDGLKKDLAILEVVGRGNWVFGNKLEGLARDDIVFGAIRKDNRLVCLCHDGSNLLLALDS